MASIMILEIVSLICTSFSGLDLGVHIRAVMYAAKSTPITMTGSIICMMKRSKKRTLTPQLVLEKKDNISKLNTLSGNAIVRKRSGHGTLTSTLGMLANI